MRDALQGRFLPDIYDLGMPQESIEYIAYFEFPEYFTPEELAEARRRLVDCQVFERCENDASGKST